MSTTSRFTKLRLAVVLGLAASWLTGCPGQDPAAAQAAHAQPLRDDPKLTQSWTMAAEHSPMATGDLGSNPEATAQALVDQGMPGIAHRVSKQCADSGALTGTESVALRFTVTAERKISPVAGDPAGAAATCMANGLATELEALTELPAGAALLRIKFHPPK